MLPTEIITRLNTIKAYAMLSATDQKAIDDAIEYITTNEERSRISRPNPLFPSFDLNKTEGD